MSSAERLAEWSRRFLAVLHDPSLHRPGLLIGSGDESRFWPFPEQGSIDELASFLEADIEEVRVLEPEAVALVLPMEASELGGFELERDYEVMVVAVDSHRRCSTLLGAVSGGEAAGWRDLTAASGYLPKIAPLLFGAFAKLETPRPDDDTEWALVEAATHDEAALEELAAACAIDLARRRGGGAKRELEGALLARPEGPAWDAIAVEAERLGRVYQGYAQELQPPFDAALAALEEPAVSQLFFSALVELIRRGSFNEPRLRSLV